MENQRLSELVTSIRNYMWEQGAYCDQDYAVLAGSLAAGLGNKTSDIDVYIVRDDATPYLEGSQFFHLDTRVDVHDLSLAELECQIVGLASASPEEISGSTMALIYRTLNGIPLEETRVLPASLVDRGNSVLKTALIAHVQYRLSSIWEQLLISRQVNDAYSYDAAAADFVDLALYGALAVKNAIYPSPKWNWEKLRLLGETGQLLGASISELSVLIDRSWEKGLWPEGVRSVLSGLGLSVHFEDGEAVPVLNGDMTSHMVGDAIFLTFGGTVYRVSSATCHLFSLCDGQRSLASISSAMQHTYGSSAFRVDLDTKHLIRRAASLGLVQLRVGPVLGPNQLVLESGVHHAQSREVSVLEPCLTEIGPLSSFLQALYSRWQWWLEFLSHQDDYRGALEARQYGAAVAAARQLVTDLAHIRLAAVGKVVSRGDVIQQIREVFGQESVLYQNLSVLRALTFLPDSDVQSVDRAVQSAIDTSLDLSVMLIGGGLRDEIGHTTLFRYANDIRLFADSHSVDVGMSPIIREKAMTYGA